MFFYGITAIFHASDDCQGPFSPRSASLCASVCIRGCVLKLAGSQHSSAVYARGSGERLGCKRDLLQGGGLQAYSSGWGGGCSHVTATGHPDAAGPTLPACFYSLAALTLRRPFDLRSRSAHCQSQYPRRSFPSMGTLAVTVGLPPRGDATGYRSRPKIPATPETHSRHS